MTAAEHGEVEVIDLLVQAGAAVDFQLPAEHGIGSAEIGKTALWFAVAARHTEAVRRLLVAGADPDLAPPDGVPLLILAALVDSVDIARLLVDHGINPTQRTARGDTVMTYANGPSAAMFTYLADAGVAPDGMAPEVAESLRWERAHYPGPDATDHDRVKFAIAVIEFTRSPRSREQAIDSLPLLGAAARAAVPALVDAVHRPVLSPTDWSAVRATRALAAIGWTPSLDAALGRLLAALPSAPAQVRFGLVDLIATAGPRSPQVVDAFVALLERGPDHELGAQGLGMLLRRPGAMDRRVRRRAVAALERTVRRAPPTVRNAARAALAPIAVP